MCDVTIQACQLVPNETGYWEFIRKLRNDPEIRSGFVEQDHISKGQQLNYMKKHNGNYYICLKDRIPVGYIGEIDGDIRIAVCANYQNKGIGTMMVNKFMVLKPDSRPKIVKENKVSQRLFEKCGFVRTRSDHRFYYYDTYLR